MKKVCMVVQDKMVKGGIAAVINGYRDSRLEDDYKIIYVESYKDGGKLTKLLKGISGYFHFAKVLLIERPDLIHIHSSFGPSFYRKIPFIYMASWFHKPIINHIHGADFEEFYVNAGESKQKLIRKVYNKCSAIIALSDEWEEKLRKIVPANKISVIHNYSVPYEDALAERLHRQCNHTVLFLGEIGRRKGGYDVPAVAEAVVKAVPQARFVMGGAGSAEDEAAIKESIRQRGIEDHVLFPGWVRGADKDRLLREADVFFLPSYNEGMPMSVLDAMGYGLPIVSTNVGGIPKIVHHEENGICCNPGDVDCMSKGIVTLLTDDALRKNAAKESFDIVLKGYSLEMHLARLESVYEEVLAK